MLNAYSQSLPSLPWRYSWSLCTVLQCLKRLFLHQAVSGIVDLNSERMERNSETESQAGLSGSDENSRDNFLGLESMNGDKLGKVSKSRHIKKGSKKSKIK